MGGETYFFKIGRNLDFLSFYFYSFPWRFLVCFQLGDTF